MSRVEGLRTVPDIRDSAPLMTIADVARLYGLTHRAIRFYEEQGLITGNRSSINHRLYDRHALDRLSFVVEARAVGMTVGELRALARSGAIDDAEKRRDAILEACTKCLHELELQLARVEATILRQPDTIPLALLGDDVERPAALAIERVEACRGVGR